jgi:hypothetical protein
MKALINEVRKAIAQALLCGIVAIWPRDESLSGVLDVTDKLIKVMTKDLVKPADPSNLG